MTVYDAGWENHSQICSDIIFWYGKFKFDVRSFAFLNLNALQNQNKLHKLLILLGEYTEKINNIKNKILQNKMNLLGF